MTEPVNTPAPPRSMVTEEPPAKRGVNRALAVVVAAVLAFLWGFSHGASMPDGRWLLAVLIMAGVLVWIVSCGRRYAGHDRADAARTEDLESRMKQYEGPEHYQDGV